VVVAASGCRATDRRPNSVSHASVEPCLRGRRHRHIFSARAFGRAAGERRARRLVRRHSLSEAHGRNVVNVIIVDFGASIRWRDRVVVFSLLAAVPLFAGLKKARREMTPHSSLLQLAARRLLGHAGGCAWVLLRGHNEPGGGFIAGWSRWRAAVCWPAFSAPVRQPLAAVAPLSLASWVSVGNAGRASRCRADCLSSRTCGRTSVCPRRCCSTWVWSARYGALTGYVYACSTTLTGEGFMSLILMFTISLIVVAGVLLVLSRDIFRLIVGLAVLGSAANLIVFMARARQPHPAVIEAGASQFAGGGRHPLPQRWC